MKGPQGHRPFRAAGALLASVALLATMAQPASSQEAETRRVSQVYLAGTGLLVDCAQHQGGACFPLEGDELEAAIGVVDDLGRQPASATWEFRSGGGDVLTSGSFCNTTRVDVPQGARELAVLVPLIDPLGCDGIALGTTGKIHVVTKVSEGDFAGFGVEPQVCLQPAPRAISLLGLTEPADRGQRVVLDVLVLLDGVDQTRGEEIMDTAAEAFDPLNIGVRYAYQDVDLPPGDGQLMMSHAMNEVGPDVPDGFDIVHVLTAKTLNVFGQADCIGGIAYSDRSYSVSSDLEDRPIQIIGDLDFLMVEDFAAKIAAHEIGHLLGAHHHYGNCVLDTLGTEPLGCTVMMDPAPLPLQLVFSTINAGIVRAHAVRFAS
jgi:hypothetical protein